MQKDFNDFSKYKTQVQDIETKANPGYRTAPGDLSCTPLFTCFLCPVPGLCLSKITLAKGGAGKAGYRTDYKSGVQDRGVPPKGDYRTGPEEGEWPQCKEYATHPKALGIATLELPQR